MLTQLLYMIIVCLYVSQVGNVESYRPAGFADIADFEVEPGDVTGSVRVYP